MKQSNVTEYPVRRGKVRDVYEIDNESLVIVTTDRISAHDHVLPNTVPGKGVILTQVSYFWATLLGLGYHSDPHDELPAPFRGVEFKDRTMLVERADVVPYECVVRGYLCGSAWEDYKKNGKSALWHKMPPGLKQNMALPNPIFTPATKEESGHDINLPREEVAKVLGSNMALELEARSLELYREAADYCWERGLILADTKFEWGISRSAGDLILIDEILTPDSSRYWASAEYALGRSLPSYDKQPLRDWLTETDWYKFDDGKNSPPPAMPEDLVETLAQRYQEIFDLLVTHSN